MKDRVFSLRNECTDLSSRYLEGIPAAECREKLASGEKDFARELSNIVIATQAELKEGQEKEKNLQGLFDGAKSEAFDLEKKKLELDKYKQDADNAKRQYDSVYKRLKDIELSGLLRTSNVRVLDAGRPPSSPVRPNVPQGVLFGCIAGLVLGLGLALLLEFLDSSVSSQSDIEGGWASPSWASSPRFRCPRRALSTSTFTASPSRSSRSACAPFGPTCSSCLPTALSSACW